VCDQLQSVPKVLHAVHFGLEVKVTVVSSILVISLGLTQRIAGRVVQRRQTSSFVNCVSNCVSNSGPVGYKSVFALAIEANTW
jgi:hypothetical protein